MMNNSVYNCVALLNGKVITIDSKDTIAQAVLIVGDRIVAVGTNEEIRQLLPKGTLEIDLEGKSVIPGIIDSHVHLELTVNNLENAVNVQTPLFESLEQIFNAIQQRAATTPKGEWIIARASNDFYNKISDKRLPTREELDRISPDHPLVLNMEVHFSMLNTLAIEELGWTQETWMPRDSTLGRDPKTGELTGYFTEGWMDDLNLSPWGYDRLLNALRVGTIKHFVSKGVTSAHELTYSIDGIRAWQQLRREDDMPLRVRMYLTHPNLINLDEFLKYGWQVGFGDDWLSIGGIKFFVDGSNRHANLHYVDDLKYTQAELNELIYKYILRIFRSGHT